MPEEKKLSFQRTEEPEKTVSAASVTALIILIVLVSIGAWFAIHHRRVAPQVPQQNPAAVQTKPLVLTQEQALVDVHSVLTIPSVLKSTSVSQGSLPPDIAGFVLPDATGVAASKASFVGGATGYVVTYADAEKVTDIFTKLVQVDTYDSTKRPDGFKTLSAVSTNLAASIQKQSSQYFLKIDISNASTGTSSVSVTVATGK